jgi:hypothetical protein
MVGRRIPIRSWRYVMGIAWDNQSGKDHHPLTELFLVFSLLHWVSLGIAGSRLSAGARSILCQLDFK